MYEPGDQVKYREEIANDSAPPGQEHCTFIIKCKHTEYETATYFLLETNDRIIRGGGLRCEEHNTKWSAHDRDLLLIGKSPKTQIIAPTINIRKFNGNIIKL